MLCPRCGQVCRHEEWTIEGRIVETFDRCPDCAWQSHFAFGGRVVPDDTEETDDE